MPVHDVSANPRITHENLHTARQYMKRERLRLSRPAVTPKPESAMTVLGAKRLPLDGINLPRISRAHVFGTHPCRTTETDREIRVALIEDTRLVREALTQLLNRSPGIRATAEASDGHERVLREFSPDVVLLDLALEGGDSLRVARDVLKNFPQARVIVMDLHPTHEELQQFIIAGVSGFVMKDAPLEEVLKTIRSVVAGFKVLPDPITSTLFSEIATEAVTNGGLKDDDSVRMTPREREIITLVAEGLSNKAIGKRLHISVHTVRSHLRNIMEKLSLNSRLQIAAFVHQQDTGVGEVGTVPAQRDEPGPRSRDRAGHFHR